MRRSLSTTILVLSTAVAACSSKSPSSTELGAAHVADLEAPISAREYWASPTDRGLQAPNRAQDFRTYFGAQGVRLEDRDAAERMPLVELSLAAMGRGDALTAVEAGDVVDRGEGRVEIARSALGLVEWFENSAAGLEQGFTLAQRPSGPEPSNSLVLELEVAGAQASAFGDAIHFATQADRRLEYGKLAVVDARGVALASHFEVPSSDRVRIVVEDDDATYPIVIDPLLTGAFDAAVESNQASSKFGLSVASAGDVNRDGYDDVIVGAPFFDQGQSEEGAAFIFLGGPSGIGNGNPATAHAVLQGDQIDALFGVSVASAGDVNGDGYVDVIVGSYLHNAGQADEGLAFVFHGSPTGIASGGSTTFDGVMESNQTNARLGFSVASAGDVNGDGYSDVIVGAYNYDSPTADEGAAFVLLGSATGIGIRNPTNAHARLEGNQTDAWFGYSVASAGDMNSDGYADVIVGVPAFDFIVGDEGGAFLFSGSAAGIANGNVDTAQAGFISDQGSSRLGESVASAGDLNGDGFPDLIVGSPYYDRGQTDEGAAFAFFGSSTGLSGLLTPPFAGRVFESNQADARYGTSVASAGDANGDGQGDVIIGAFAYDSDELDEGVAFVYSGRAAPFGSLLAELQYDQADAFVGYSVASAGDVNGDGFTDVLAGAYLANGGQADEGVAFAYHGGAFGIRTGQSPGPFAGLGIELQSFGILILLNIAPLDAFVFAPAGDVNGDGFDDAIIGLPRYDGAQPDSGAAFVVHGSSTGLRFIPSQLSADAGIFGDQAGEHFGAMVASAGDVNGDGYADVIVASRHHAAGESGEGAAFVFLGSANGIASGGTSVAHARLETNQVGAGVHFVSAAGDVNGDGYGDVLVSSELFDAGTTDEGAAFVWVGSSAGIDHGNPSTALARFETDQASAGVRASSAGDLNGDGFGDVVVHSDRYDSNETNEGAAFVLLGSSTGIPNANPTTAHARLETNQADAGGLSRTYSPGDVNGDGYADLVFRAPAYDNGEDAEGATFLFHGSASGVASGNPATANTRIEANQTGAILGFSRTYVDSDAFDVNADGYADIMLQAQIGTAVSSYFYHGSPTGIPNGDLSTADSVLVHSGSAICCPGGDFNGDGRGDVLGVSGTLGQTEISPGELAVFIRRMNLYSIQSDGGLPTFALQRRGDGSGILVSPGGLSQASQFVAELFVRSPRGREYGKLEIEYCEGADAVFGGPTCLREISPSWTDLGAGGALLARTIPGLNAGTTYIWRARGRYASYRATPPGPTVSGVAGPWYRVGARPRATDIRIGTPEPSALVALAVGSLTLASLGRRRREGSPRARVGTDRQRVQSRSARGGS